MSLPNLITGAGGLPQASASPSYGLVWNGTLWVPEGAGATPTEDGLYAGNAVAYDSTPSGGLRARKYQQPDAFVSWAPTAYTAGVAQTVYTPASGKRWCIAVGNATLSVAGQLIVKSGSTEVWRSNVTTVASFAALVVGLNANDVLALDVSASGNLSGWVGVYDY